MGCAFVISLTTDARSKRWASWHPDANVICMTSPVGYLSFSTLREFESAYVRICWLAHSRHQLRTSRIVPLIITCWLVLTGPVLYSMWGMLIDGWRTAGWSYCFERSSRGNIRNWSLKLRSGSTRRRYGAG
jgi:hypothetical protein